MKENIIYKGSEKRVIVVKSSSSKHFEEAHFFLKAGEEPLTSMPDLLKEANRIVEQTVIPPLIRQKQDRRRWFGRGLSVGFTAAALASLGIWLLGWLAGRV